MSSVEDWITDSLWSIKSYSFNFADRLDRRADALANSIRDSLSSSTWLPEYARPLAPPPRTTPTTPAPTSLLEWAWQHRWTVGLTAAGLSSGVGYVYLRRRKSRKRRARRAPNGARKEVVVLAGSPHDALVKSLATDLEHRGFIVFVVVGSLDDEQAVAALGGRDLRPLHLDLLDAAGAAAAAQRFGTYLSTPVQAFAGASPHTLHLAGLLLVGGTDFPTGPVESLPAPDWHDTLNLRLLAPLLTAQHFLRPLRESAGARLLVLSPAIVPALAPPFHAPEAAAVAALDAFAASLRRELLPLGVPVCTLKLGTFDLAAAVHTRALHAARAGIGAWPAGLREAYARSYAADAGRFVRGSPLRELHLKVFDVLTGTPRSVVRVGSGSRVYEVVGRWAPDWLVMWMLGAGGRGKDVQCGGMVMSCNGSSGSERSVEWEKV